MNDYMNTAEIYDVLFKTTSDELHFYSRYIKKNKSVLEVGCGTGNVIIELLINSRGKRFSCLDVSKNMLSILKEKYDEAIQMGRVPKGKQLDIIESDMCNFTTDEKYDLIIFPGESIQTVPKTTVERVIDKYLGFLSDTGKLILTTFDPYLVIGENCKDTLYGIGKKGNSIYLSFKEITSLTKDEHKYRMISKKYGQNGNLEKSYSDEFCISVIDDDFLSEMIDRKKYSIDKRTNGFRKTNAVDSSYSVIVINKTLRFKQQVQRGVLAVI